MKRSRTKIPPPLLTQNGKADEIPQYRTVVVARCASDTCFRIEAFENQDSTTVAYLRWYNSRNTVLQLFPVAIVLRTELRLFYLSRTVVAARYVSDACFRLEAFENQRSTTVAYLTWYISRNTAPQVFPVVVEQRTELRLFYLSRTMVVARCASDTCSRIEAFEHQDSTTVANSTWDYRRNAPIQEFSVVIVLRIELRLFYLSRTVVSARYVSDACFRLEAFENQHSTTVAYLTWYILRNTEPQVFPIVAEQRTKLRLFYLSRTMVVGRCASDTCYRLEAFENQRSTTVAYLTWYTSRNTAPQVFPVVVVLIIEMLLFYLSRTMVVARCASDTCFRIEAFENQHSTTVVYLTRDYRRNTSLQVFAVVVEQGTELRLFYLSRTMVVARCASDTCFLRERSRTRIPPPLLTLHGIIEEMPQYKSFLL
ncbi:hypothetical protein ANTQUA_LOCUS6923 [Anthophora quadrimaculata]